MGFKMKITYAKGLFGVKTVVEVSNPEPITTEKELLKLVEQFSEGSLTKGLVDNPPAEPKEEEVQKARPRAVELIGSERSEGFNLAELMAEKLKEVSLGQPKKEEPKKEPKEPRVYGKYENAPVWVECMSCGHEGEQTCFASNRFIKCENCKEKLYLHPTTAVRGQEDDEGFVFDAKYKYYTPEELWKKRNEAAE